MRLREPSGSVARMLARYLVSGPLDCGHSLTVPSPWRRTLVPCLVSLMSLEVHVDRNRIDVRCAAQAEEAAHGLHPAAAGENAFRHSPEPLRGERGHKRIVFAAWLSVSFRLRVRAADLEAKKC